MVKVLGNWLGWGLRSSNCIKCMQMKGKVYMGCVLFKKNRVSRESKMEERRHHSIAATCLNTWLIYLASALGAWVTNA